MATFETTNYNAEQNQFLRMEDARIINSRLFDHTYDNQPLPVDGAAYSERLSGSANEKTGIAHSISVMPGDIINMEVYAKYVDPSHDNDPALNALFLAELLASRTLRE